MENAFGVPKEARAWLVKNFEENGTYLTEVELKECYDNIKRFLCLLAQAEIDILKESALSNGILHLER